MSFSILYSAITRGKWFIDFREVDAHQMLIHSFLERDIEMENKSKLSEREPIPFLMNSGAEVFYGTDYLQAPANSTAIIPLHGSMLKYGTYCSYGTTEIADMIDMAVESPKISGLILDIDSGGGSVDAIAPLVCSIQNARKKQKCVIAYADLCASAAYYVACYCNEIIASNNISSEFGSIGVMMSFMDYEKYYESNGVKQHTIYSDLSNYKNEPFELARKGEYEKIRSEELNPLARKFQEAVKHQRGDKLNQSIEGILAGRMFYAETAQENGLNDNMGNMDYAIQRVNEIRRDAVVNEYINSKF